MPQANLTSLDPVWTTATVTRNFALMVYETLYGRDEAMRPQPQMLEGGLMEDGGKRWTLRLREGQTFHDGERVLAREPGHAGAKAQLGELAAKAARR